MSRDEVRTYRREDFEASRAAWDTGEFSDEWRPFRHRAAERGFIYPPTGSRWDGWDDDEPSQRAILIRAIRETPDLLLQCIDRSSTWSQAIGRLLAARTRWREDLDLRDRDVAWERADEPDGRQATTAIAGILGRIRDSAP